MGNHGSNMDDILAEDMHHWYNKFMKESPSGLITLFELKAILNLKGITESANSYVEQVFFTFDMDGVGTTETHNLSTETWGLNVSAYDSWEVPQGSMSEKERKQAPLLHFFYFLLF